MWRRDEPISWLWVALGLVGVGLTGGVGADNNNEEDKIDRKGRRTD